ncbi:hypothetical protein NA57DRAFT_32607 [Rhizodiscina lignyota]|uniref:Pyoverdine/dityrosine biosynthesis protein n=1 Tax=Rhizodiscina lignyota TaxID=1504668 RepID=A0A9P4IMJ3_9PEZI|nr:hypothetical protein NA57DRAFT_32607 [Rhizodiscina lignyota]
MEALNNGTSVYHDIHTLYCRTYEGELLAAEGRNISYHGHRKTQILEVHDAIRHIVRGLVYCIQENGKGAGAFRNWIFTVFLRGTKLQPFCQTGSDENGEARALSEEIAVIFDARLRNTLSKGDAWHSDGGRAYFVNRVYGYVEKGLPVQFGLPAFPCKSPNPRKVGGMDPDAAECLALDVLRSFIAEITEIYPTGATLWIISDGHVFSDCIGVDDDKVTFYDDRLREIYAERYPSAADQKAIQFKGLKELFFSNDDLRRTFSDEWMQGHDIFHPLQTRLCDDAELSRKLMMAACEIDQDNFRALLKHGDNNTLRTYRGLSRFMLEDIAHPSFAELSSVSQRKKLACKVAGEMIARNQAYSNLLELLFPNFIRLSIHAHPNKGPKFGIRLFSKDRVREIESLDRRHEPKPSYDFQVPTPWHNSILKVEGEKSFYLAKASVAEEAIASGRYQGGWVDGPDGGHFNLREKPGSESMEAHVADLADAGFVGSKSQVPQGLQRCGMGMLVQTVKKVWACTIRWLVWILVSRP